MIKRLFDIISSASGLLVISPLFVIIALAIKIDSKGSIFYKQERIGRNGKSFKILKFRTMRVNSDKGSQITVGGRDPRITEIGYYLRKFKLDELPQLINVFIGDMSIVGPRPEVPRYVNLYTAEQRRVLSVRPGITDAASITYRNENEILGEQADPETYYINVIMPDKLRLNLEYVDNMSIAKDLALIFSTFAAIAKK